MISLVRRWSCCDGQEMPRAVIQLKRSEWMLLCRFLGRHARRLGSAWRCLASEKRSSGKSRGWSWWIVCCYGDLGGGLACCWLIRTVFYRRHQLLPYRWFDRRMTLGPQAMCQTAEVAIIDLWRAFHAAVLTVAGGALGYCFGAIVSKMISCPPQHWHGIARTRGG